MDKITEYIDRYWRTERTDNITGDICFDIDKYGNTVVVFPGSEKYKLNDICQLEPTNSTGYANIWIASTTTGFKNVRVSILGAIEILRRIDIKFSKYYPAFGTFHSADTNYIYVNFAGFINRIPLANIEKTEVVEKVRMKIEVIDLCCGRRVCLIGARSPAADFIIAPISSADLNLNMIFVAGVRLFMNSGAFYVLNVSDMQQNSTHVFHMRDNVAIPTTTEAIRQKIMQYKYLICTKINTTDFQK